VSLSSVSLDLAPRGPLGVAPPLVEIGLAALLIAGVALLVLRRRRR
jgi:LPXTG-motif cell wall-anchored protein